LRLGALASLNRLAASGRLVVVEDSSDAGDGREKLFREMGSYAAAGLKANTDGFLLML
jgi:hypothetical protein